MINVFQGFIYKNDTVGIILQQPILTLVKEGNDDLNFSSLPGAEKDTNREKFVDTYTMCRTFHSGDMFRAASK